MTRKELREIQKPGTGLGWHRDWMDAEGYCKISISLVVRWGSLMTVKDMIEAFKTYLRVAKDKD